MHEAVEPKVSMELQAGAGSQKQRASTRLIALIYKAS
jgi:hypothetical protein